MSAVLADDLGDDPHRERLGVDDDTVQVEDHPAQARAQRSLATGVIAHGGLPVDG